MTQTRTRLVYLLAASHSGSTLLAFLLGSHPEICSVGELKLTHLGNVERYRCSCGEPILRCPFWTAVGDRLAAEGHALDFSSTPTDFTTRADAWAKRLLRPLHRGPLLEGVRDAALVLDPLWHPHLARTQGANAALAAAVCSLARKPVIADSSKVGIRLKFLLRNPAFDVKVVRLVRDGRAVALTYMDPASFADAREARRRDGGSGGDRLGQRLSMADAAREWRRSTEEGEAIVRGLPARSWSELRYEQLCADPQGALEPVLECFGVDPRAPLALKGYSHHVVGNGMRFDSTREIRLDERWKTALGPKDLATFDSVAGDLNRRLGYR